MAFYLIAPAPMYREKVAPAQRLDGDETIDAAWPSPRRAACDNVPTIQLHSERPAMTSRLIVMDIDSTLINQEVIDLLGEEAGVGRQVARITERAMRGELDFKQALEERVGLLAGLDESVFERTFERVTFTPGALELVRSAHSKGWKVGVVSGGFHEVADKIVAAAGIDFCLANRLEVVDGKLTGKLAADIVTKESKLIQLLDWAVECGVDMAHTVAIGDGANDIPMIQAAGTGIAFCAKPKTREAAPFAIDERNLMLAMDIILRD